MKLSTANPGEDSMSDNGLASTRNSQRRYNSSHDVTQMTRRQDGGSPTVIGRKKGGVENETTRSKKRTDTTRNLARRTPRQLSGRPPLRHSTPNQTPRTVRQAKLCSSKLIPVSPLHTQVSHNISLMFYRHTSISVLLVQRT